MVPTHSANRPFKPILIAPFTNPFSNSSGILVSKTSAPFFISFSNSGTLSAFIFRFIISSSDEYPVLLICAFNGKYAGGVDNPEVISLINSSRLIFFKA